jgi:hypothetical protein
MVYDNNLDGKFNIQYKLIGDWDVDLLSQSQ